MSDMALIKVPCPKCGKIYRIYRSNIGRTGICKKCSARFRMIPNKDKVEKKKPKQFSPVVRSAPPEKKDSKVKEVIEKLDEVLPKKEEEKTKSNNQVKADQKSEDSVNSKQTPDSKKLISSELAPISQKNMDILASQLKIIVTDGMKAYIVEKTLMDKDVNIADIKKFLMREKIVFGIVSDDKIQSFIDKRLNRIKPFLIAKGVEPTEPVHGLIEYFFDTNPIKSIDPSMVEEQNRIDYKERGEMPFINKGDLIAQRIPGIPGKHGKDVFGKRIEAQKARQASLKCGNGATLSEDKRMAHARIDGMPILSTGRYERVNVLPQYYINGDVNMKTGNIRFKGPVVVKGTVQSGFKIRCASLEAKELFRADVRVDGNIHIHGGVVGSKISCLGSFKAKYVKGSTIQCEEDIVVANGIVDSRIETRKKCVVEKNRILTSSIMALQEIITQNVGSKSSPGCELTIGVDPVLMREMENHKKEIKLLEEKIVNVQENADIDTLEELIDEKKEIIQKIDELTEPLTEAKKIVSSLIKTYKVDKKKDLSKNRINIIDAIRKFSEKIGPAKQEMNDLQNKLKAISEIIQQIHNMKQEIEFATSEIQRINRQIQTTDQEGKILVKDDIFPGTIIHGTNACIEVFEKQNNVKIQEIHVYNENNTPDKQIELISLNSQNNLK